METSCQDSLHVFVQSLSFLSNVSVSFYWFLIQRFIQLWLLYKLGPFFFWLLWHLATWFVYYTRSFSFFFLIEKMAIRGWKSKQTATHKTLSSELAYLNYITQMKILERNGNKLPRQFTRICSISFIPFERISVLFGSGFNINLDRFFMAVHTRTLNAIVISIETYF